MRQLAFDVASAQSIQNIFYRRLLLKLRTKLQIEGCGPDLAMYCAARPQPPVCASMRLMRAANSILIRSSSSSSAGICLVEVGDDDLLHLHHGLHGAIGLFAIGIAQVTAECRGHNLP